LEEKELFPGVVLYSNVLDDIDGLLSYMKDSSGSDKWKHDTWPDHRNPGKLSRSYHQYVLFKNDDFAVSVLDKIKKLDEILLDYCKKYDVELLEHETPRAMIYEPGCFFGAHKDDTFSHPRRVSTVLYINDDYVGGEIFFPLINLRIQPKKNEFLVFPSAYLFTHEVSEVRDADRFVIVGFGK
jgi:hypothetical protein